LRATLQARFCLLGLKGLVTIAIADVEMAAWDACGAILAEPVRVAGGLAYPPDRPGAGLEWDESAVRRWSVS
jgi:L-alanine-DL-glutamate epimerase-like enolase superfamily enzyme